MAKIELKGVVERVLRSNGKPTKMVVSIAAEHSANVPLGNVSMQIEAVQGALFSGPKASGVGPSDHPAGRRVAGARA
jgi:hypothetical protein